MPTQSHTSYPPDSIIALALKYPEHINLNRRLPHWPEEVRKANLKKVRRDFMFPPFARFLSQVNAGALVLICYQDSAGGILTLATTVKEICWTGGGDVERKGTHATVWFENKNRRPDEPISLWGNFVLAVGNIRCLPEDAKCQRDPNGTHFVELFEQCGVV